METLQIFLYGFELVIFGIFLLLIMKAFSTKFFNKKNK